MRRQYAKYGHERGVRLTPHPNLKPDACSL